ncbi:hypothetical protein niasHT_003782 [Heterodera trifolii]|uniref:DUF7773 domain-containing protein n=1 Tax=Heterodera trifolii TaxID=157864 RepID=A0ABD2LUY8_9BILA
MSRILSLLLLLPLSMAMICYNSQAVNPSRESICEPEEVCFGEYFSLRHSHDASLVAHFFDRFCVHRQHCLRRGFLPEGRACLRLDQLDAAVAQTFRDKLKSERMDPNRLLHTRFCCCSDKNFCNRMDAKEIGKLFNVSVTTPQHQMLRAEGRKAKSQQNGSGGRERPRWWTVQTQTIAMALLYMARNILCLSLNGKTMA